MNDDEAIAKLIAERMIERRDVKAVQDSSGDGYRPHRDDQGANVPMRGRDILAHLAGQQTYGHYLVKPETNTCRMFCFDIDLRKGREPKPDGTVPPTAEPVFYHEKLEDEQEILPRVIWRTSDPQVIKRDLALQLTTMARDLAGRIYEYQFPTIISYSGAKGVHVYGLLEKGTPAVEARGLANIVLGSFSGEPFTATRGDNFFRASGYPALEIEVFPKQDAVGADGFGNLIRLPLGINRKSGQPGFFLDYNSRMPKIDNDVIATLQNGSIR